MQLSRLLLRGIGLFATAGTLIAFAVLGLLLSVFFVRETHDHARAEARRHANTDGATDREATDKLSFTQVFALTSWKDRALFAASQAGMINNLNDGMVWGILPLFLAGAGRRGFLDGAALYA